MQKLATKNFPREAYFKLIGIPANLTLKPSVETLYFVVNKHAISFPYQNFHFHHKDRKALGMTLEALTERMIDQNVGGMCFETNELMYYALEHLGFNVSRVAAYALNGGEHNPATPSSHIFCHVEIDERRFLVDIGYGYNAIRYPLEFTFNKTEEVEITPYEKYKLVPFEDHYVLYVWIKDEWYSFYRFENPIKVIDESIATGNYNTVIESPLFIPIRDKILRAGRMTNEGRVGIYYEPKTRPFFAWKIDIQKGKSTKTDIHDYQTLQEEVEKIVGYKLPDQGVLRLDD